MKIFTKFLIIMASGILLSSAAYSQTIYYVKSGGNGSGNSWNNASGNLQSMIDQAQSGDQIWVAEGTYKPGSFSGASGSLTSRDVSFVLKSGVSIYGGFSGNETQLSLRDPESHTTILSGDIGAAGNSADNAHHVVVSINNTSETLLDGFTITGGNANEDGYVSANGFNITRSFGGGIYTISSSAAFRNIVINKNHCSGGSDFYGNGAGIYSYTSQLTIEDAVISENTSGDPGTKGGTSGAIYAQGSASMKENLNLTRVTIENNTSKVTAGAIFLSIYTDAVFTDVRFINNKANGGGGGAIYVSGESDEFNNLTMDRVIMKGNSGSGAGGAVYMKQSNYRINNSIFSENKSTSAGGVFFLFSSGSPTTPDKNAIISNSVFYKNESQITSALGGGALFVSNGTISIIEGCTFYANQASFDGGAIGIFSNASVKATIANCIFYDNVTNGSNADFYSGAAATLNLSNTITQTSGSDGIAGVKVGVNPLFASTDPQNDQFLYLLQASPAVDAGDNSVIPAGITKDLAGNDRIFNNTVDMGPYEYNDQSTEPTKSQTITFNSDITKDYGDAPFSPNASASSGLPVSYVIEDTSIAKVVNDQIKIIGAGVTGITAIQEGDFQYLPADSVTRTLTIHKAPLTIQPADTVMIQGATLPDFKAIYTGFVYNDDENSLTTEPTITTTATSSSPQGEYDITAADAVSNNYDIQYKKGKLTILLTYPTGKIRYVRATAHGTGSGLSWADASDDLQAMIDSSHAGGEVWVASGTYIPSDLPGEATSSDPRDVAFSLKSKVKIFGGFKGTEARRSDRDIDNNKTILSGDIGTAGDNTDNTYHVVVSVKDTNAVLDGFTITKGLAGDTNSYTIEDVVVPQSVGGGVYITKGIDVELNHVTITDNQTAGENATGAAGGMYIKDSKTAIKNTIISNNTTSGKGGKGAGIYLIGSPGSVNETTLNNVSILDNTSVGSGGGGYIHNYTITTIVDSKFENNSGKGAAALHMFGNKNYQSVLKVKNTDFNDNISSSNGGAMIIGPFSDVDFENDSFTGNSGTYQGGAMYIAGSIDFFNHITIKDCFFSKNKLSERYSTGGALGISSYVDCRIINSEFYQNENSGNGGAIGFGGSSYSPSKNLYVINSTFYGNKAKTGGGINAGIYLTANIINCTFYDNEATDEGGAVNISSNKSTKANIVNTVFNKNKAPSGNDIYQGKYGELALANSYTQETGTDGVDGIIIGNDPNFESTDVSNSNFLQLTVLSNAVDHGDNSAIPADITQDLAGNDRIHNNIVDMGAYEYNGPPLNPTLSQTITFSGNISKTYGDTDFDPGAVASSDLAVIYLSGDPSIAAPSDGGHKIKITGAGSTTITATQPGDAQYKPAESVEVTLTVAKASLTIKPKDTSIEQGTDFPDFSATYTGLVNGDTEASLSAPPAITTTATEVSSPGTYPLTASGAQSDDYDITYQPGTLTIIPKVRIPAEKQKIDVWFSSPNELQVQMDMVSGQKALLILYSNTGIPVYQSNKVLYPGGNQFTIPAGRLPSGIYILNIRGSNLKFEKKIIKR